MGVDAALKAAEFVPSAAVDSEALGRIDFLLRHCGGFVSMCVSLEELRCYFQVVNSLNCVS